MGVSAEIAALAGVVLGAVVSFAATYAADKASWLRSQAVRWDERRLSAYADYSNTVKELVAMASRIAAGRGLDSGVLPLDPSQDNLAKLAEAEARRTLASETLRLLTDIDTMAAAREMTQCAWELTWLAQGSTEGDDRDWKLVYSRYEEARDQYITCARQNLQVPGSHVPDNPRLRSRERPASNNASPSARPESLEA